MTGSWFADRSTPLSRPVLPHPLDDLDPAPGALPPAASVRTDARVISLPSEWRFRWHPSPALAPRGVGDPSFDDSEWGTIAVPSSFVMPVHGATARGPHGVPAYTNQNYPFPLDAPFAPDDNPVGDHRVRFTVDDPPDRAELRFAGIEGAADVWLNGALVGSTRGSRLPTAFDVAGLVADDNLLVVRVHQFSSASYLEDQDAWWLPGIIREVTLCERPAGAIHDLRVVADWHPDGAHLRLEVATDSTYVRAAMVELAIELVMGDIDRRRFEPLMQSGNLNAHMVAQLGVEISTMARRIRTRQGS